VISIHKLIYNLRLFYCQRKLKINWAPVAHAYNPSYSGGRVQEDGGSKPASQPQANCSQAPISKQKSQRKAGGVTRGVGPEFKPHCHKKKKNAENKLNMQFKNLEKDQGKQE
jgi:hypothetical protein